MSVVELPRVSPVDVAELTEAQATLLMPLWARARESREPRPILRDEAAERIVSQLDFDFRLFQRKAVPVVDYCLRAAVFDRVVQDFLHRHPQGAVVELGVGLDTRFDRLDNDEATWTELDLPAVMQVRQQFFQPDGQRAMIAGSLLDDAWLEQVRRRVAGKPTLLVAEGVLYFFTQSQVRRLLRRMADAAPGAELVFDAQSRLFLTLSNWRHPLGDSSLKFSLGDPRQLESWDERLGVRQWIGFGDSPHYDQGMLRLPALKRWGRRCVPWIRNCFKVVRVGW